MDADREPYDQAVLRADAIHRQLGALTDASMQRHRLAPGSAEYDAALQIEEQLADHVWRLATDLHLYDSGEQPADHRSQEPDRG